MSGPWHEQRPRDKQTVPVPTPMQQRAANSSAKATGTELREKLSEFQAENNLLGTLVKELKAERDGLQKRLTSATRQHTDAASRAATAVQQVDAAGRDQKRLAGEVERLSSVVHSHSVRLQKAKALQQELEDVALDLRAELDEARSKQEAAEQAAAAAAQRATAAEAKLEAAGMGPMPRMGPTAEQLVINSTQRIRELTEELATLRSEGQRKLADAQQQLARAEQDRQQQLDAARAEAREAQQQLERRLQQQAWELEQQSSRAQESEQQCRSLQQQVLTLQQSSREAQLSAEACAELECSRQALSSSNQALQQQVTQLQQQLSERESAQAASATEQQQLLATVQREQQQLSANLAAVRQAEASHRLSTAESSSKVERLRGELLRCVGELQQQLAASAAAGQAQQQAQQQLQALEATAAAARAEAAEARQQLVELASVSMAELREQVAGQAVAITGLPDDMGASLPGPVTSYIKVLERVVADGEKRSRQLLEDALLAQQYERDTRQALTAAREAQAVAERALQQQTQRLMAAERMRLSDLKEQQSLEKRLALAQQECAHLRDALLNWGLNSSSGQQVAGPQALAGAGQQQKQQQYSPFTSEAWSPTVVGPGSFAAACGADGVGSACNSPGKWALGPAAQQRSPGGLSGGNNTGIGLPGLAGSSSPGAGAAASPSQAGVSAGSWANPSTAAASAAAATGTQGTYGLASPSKAQQQPGQEQGQGQGAAQAHTYSTASQHEQGQQQQPWQQLPAADAGHTSADVAAASAATISRYQAKLAQLRAMKEQLMRKTYGEAAEPDTVTDPTTTAASVPRLNTEAVQQHQQHHQQQQQQQQVRQQVPSAVDWTPRSGQTGSWLIGAASAGGATLSGHAPSSSGGTSHLSAWSLPGRAAGVTPRSAAAAAAGGVAGKVAGEDAQLSKLGASIQKTKTAAAAAAATGSGVGSASHGLSSRSHLQRWAQPQPQQPALSRQHSSTVGSRRATGSHA